MLQMRCGNAEVIKMCWRGVAKIVKRYKCAGGKGSVEAR